MDATFARRATVTANTKRSHVVSGKRGAQTIYLTGVKCTPLDPASGDIAKRLALDTPNVLLATFVESSDIVESDTLVVGAKEYPIKNVDDWTWRDTTYQHLVVEDLKMTVKPWYLPTGVTNDHAIGIYSALGVADYKHSLINQAHPGVHDLSDYTYVYANPGVALAHTPPGWNASDGWVLANDPNSFTPTMALATGITSAQIGRGTGTVIVFFTGLGCPKEGDVNSLVCGMYSLQSSSDRYTFIELATYKPAGTPQILVTQNGHVVQPGSDTDNTHHPAFANAGMMAIAGQHGYFNGAYTNFTNMPVPPWQNDRDTRDTYIGSQASFYETATFPIPDMPTQSNVVWSSEGVRANIQHVLFFDVALTKAQLDEVMANAPR